MIESPEGMDRGVYLYQKFPKAVRNYVKDRKDTYFDSKPAKALKSRVKLIDDIIDMKFPQSESSIAEIAMPVVRKRWRELNAFIRKYFENDPMITFTQIGDTPEENAMMRTQLVNRNFASTDFRKDCLRWIIDSASRYGSYVMFTQYVEKSGRSAGRKTTYNPDGLNQYPREFQQQRKQNAVTYPVHVLNYFCDIDKNCYSKGTYEGIQDNWRISTLYTLLKDENYIKENVEKIISQCKKGHVDENYHGNEKDSELADYSRETVTVSRVFTNLNFAGNEDDPGEYFTEFIDGEIIRINESGLDDNERPISTATLINRTNTWWGNTDLEDVIPQQNVKNWLMQTEIESVAKQLDSFILAKRGSIDAADWNNRHQLGGLVYTDVENVPLDKIMYQFQRRDFSLNNLDWVNREINQSVQESSPVVNLQNKYNQGGLNNSTLGAAQMAATIGEILQYDMMNNFSYGLLHTGKISANILEIMLDDRFIMPIKKQSVILEKHQIMGEFSMLHESTLKINDVAEFTKKVNLLTQFLNWRGTGDPSFQGINVPKMVRDVIKAGNGWYSDVDDYYTDQPMQQQPIGPAGQQQLPPPSQQQQPQPLTGVNG
jgi:hypothetical protein